MKKKKKKSKDSKRKNSQKQARSRNTPGVKTGCAHLRMRKTMGIAWQPMAQKKSRDSPSHIQHNFREAAKLAGEHNRHLTVWGVHTQQEQIKRMPKTG